MDVKTDKTLRMRLRESMGDSTMLIVAQRVGSILDADRILVMEDGQIVGRASTGNCYIHVRSTGRLLNCSWERRK